MATKAGVHITTGSRNGYGKVAAAVPAAVLSVHDGSALTEAKQFGGERVITIYREQKVYNDYPPHLDQMSEVEARHAADQNWPQLLETYRQNPADYYQVTNEFGGEDPVSLRNLVAFETRLMELAEGDGLKLAVASQAGGSPGNWDLWVNHFVPLIRRAEQGRHIYSRHAYGGVGSDNQMLTKLSNGIVIPADDNAARPFREAIYLKRQGITTPMVLTEAGQRAGFDFPGVQPFMEDVRRYDTLCLAHENIWAFCLWTYGEYRNANIQEASDELAAYIRNQGGAGKPRWPGWRPLVDTEPQRIEHVIHLLPQDATVQELNQLVTLLHPNRSTFTYSADAAHAIAHGGSAESRVVVWAGHRWAPADIFHWLGERAVRAEARDFPTVEDSPSAGRETRTRGQRRQPTRLAHTIHLLPQDSTLQEVQQAASTLHPARSAFTYSADAAHALDHAGDANSKVVVWSAKRWDGDILHWLHERNVQTEERSLSETASSGIFTFSHWPTDHFAFTQRFRANPAIYAEFNLPGHEGVDIVAPFNTIVRAVAPGTVYKIREASEGHAYGNVIYIRHQSGYRTAYAHLKEVLVRENDPVTAGQPLGRADSTGNVFPKPTAEDPTRGTHLHLTLYLDGASERGETDYPRDIVDPTPFLEPLLEATWTPPAEPLVSGWAFANSLERRGSLARVKTSFINLRVSPGTNQRKLGRVPEATVMRITGPRMEGYYPVLVPEAGVQADETPAIPQVTLEFGMHNQDGAEWMQREGIRGWGLHAVALGGSATTLDLTGLENAGIKMLVRLNYGFHPRGNIPLENDPEYESFIEACIKTIKQSSGVWGWIIGNETNNPLEWPGGVHGTPITAEAYTRLYNRIWFPLPASVRISPQAIDPYYGPGSDNRAYWSQILDNIQGAEFLTVHPKTQDSNPDHVDSDAKFTNDPLRWQYLHLRSYEPLLEVIPPRFSHLPVIATEVNPQRHNDGTTLGWQEDQGAEWVRRAARHFRRYNDASRRPISGVIFYRFSADVWACHNKPSILAAIKEVAQA